jgi:hypothetical protein
MMKQQAANEPATTALPSFLDDTTAVDATDISGAPADSQEPGPEQAASGGEVADPGMADPASTNPEPQARRSSPRSRRSAATAPAATAHPGGGVLWITAGALAIAAAILLGVLQPALPLLDRLRLGPTPLLLVGTTVLAFGLTRRHLRSLQAQLAEGRAATQDLASLQEGLQFLIEAQQQHANQPAAAGDELHHLLLASQRQDEKLNNLTKAIKMYGKPLMEIAGHSTELVGGLGQLRTSVDTAAESNRQAWTRMETQLQKAGQWKAELGALQTAIDAVAKARPGDDKALVATLQPLLSRLEVSVQAIAQRLENPELQKSLLRLEDQTRNTTEQLARLLAGEALQQAIGRLETHVDRVVGKVGQGLEQLRAGNLQAVEGGVREIQREVSGVATAIAQIQVAVKANTSRPTATATPAEPAPAAPSTATPTAPTTATPPTPSASAASTAAASTDAGAAYQTGTRTSGSKNVLGAIAKLKQMKS